MTTTTIFEGRSGSYSGKFRLNDKQFWGRSDPDPAKALANLNALRDEPRPGVVIAFNPLRRSKP